MHVSRSQIDDNFFARHPEAHRLKCSYGSQQTFLDCGIRKSDKMNPEPLGNVYFYSHKYRFDTYALGAVNVDKHGMSFLAPNLIIMSRQVLKKKKNVAK